MKKFDDNNGGNKKIVFRTKLATGKEIYSHLIKCDRSFIPPLSERVNLDEYAKKLFDKSITFETWSDHNLVGLLAAYFNDKESKIGYISNVSVVKGYQGTGIASELVKQCIGYGKQHKFREIKLEVHKDSDPARRLYKKFGFIDFGVKDNFVSMKLNIN